jgi:hypothetical protein
MTPEVRKEFNKFLQQVVLTGIILLLGFFALRYFTDSSSSYLELALSWLVCTLNVAAGAWIILFGLSKNSQVFFSVVFGSMFVRILLILGFVLIGVLLADFETVTFVVSLFTFYFIFLVLELIFLSKISKRRVK